MPVGAPGGAAGVLPNGDGLLPNVAVPNAGMLAGAAPKPKAGVLEAVAPKVGLL